MQDSFFTSLGETLAVRDGKILAHSCVLLSLSVQAIEAIAADIDDPQARILRAPSSWQVTYHDSSVTAPLKQSKTVG